MAMGNQLVRSFLVMSVVGLTAACGGAQFKAAANQAPQKALKYGTKVELADSADALPQPVVIVGTLSETTKKGEEDRKSVEKNFKTLASAKGCDAIVGLRLDTEEQHSTQKVYHKDADGKVTMAMEEVITPIHRWTGSCVRSAAADGGAAPAAKPAVRAPGPAPEPAVVANDTDPAVRDVVAKLSTYEITYLRQWREKLHAPTVEPLDAVGATLELMAQVDKFWKITVPNEWLGCRNDPRSEQCVHHAKLIKELRRVDDLRHDMERLDRSGAALNWLRKNGNRVAVYLDTFVPAETSDSAMRATPFWAAHDAH